MYKIPEEIIREATANHSRLNIEVRQMMIEMGVPVEMVGISQFGRNKSEAFSVSTAVGGTHSVPVHGQIYIPEMARFKTRLQFCQIRPLKIWFWRDGNWAKSDVSRWCVRLIPKSGMIPGMGG